MNHFIDLIDPLLHREAAPVVVILFDVESRQDVASVRCVHRPKFFYRGLGVCIRMTAEISAM